MSAPRAGRQSRPAFTAAFPGGTPIETALAARAPAGIRIEPGTPTGRLPGAALPYPVLAGAGVPFPARRALPERIAARFPDLDRPRDPGLVRAGRRHQRRSPCRARHGWSGQPGGRAVPDRHRAWSRALRPARRRGW